MKLECVSDSMSLGEKTYPCPISVATGLAGGKQKAIIIYCPKNGPKRFGESRRVLTSSTETVLSNQPKQSEQDGLVSRQVLGTKPPPKTMYLLTDFGRTFLPALNALTRWGNQVVSERGRFGPAHPLPRSWFSSPHPVHRLRTGMNRSPNTLILVKNTLRICLGLLFIVTTSRLPTPVQACACGVLVIDSEVSINAETAFVVMNSGRERIDMVVHLDGEAFTVAWIMPLSLGGKVSLGDKDVFGRLKGLTKPHPRYVPQFLSDSKDGGPQSGVGGSKEGAASGVQTVDVQTVGSLEVTTLQGTSAAAVNEWLEINGFPA